MAERGIPGHDDLRLVLRRTRAARRFSLRVSRLDGRITLTMPERARVADAMDFAAGQAEWLRAAVGRAAPAQAVGIGTELPFAGGLLRVTAGAVRAPRIEGGLLIVPPDPLRAGLRAAACLRLAARDRLAQAAGAHAAALGRRVAGLTLRDPRGRWGSCSAEGRLMFSWRLVMAPPEVLDYVAAHEAAHLAEMNHSPAFWRVVARLFPDHARARDWLRREGPTLHGWRFGHEGRGEA